MSPAAEYLFSFCCVALLYALFAMEHFYPSLQPMKVFKFGGASVSTVERVKNVGSILKKYEGEQLLVIVSAMGKTTNALEKVVGAFYDGNKDTALRLFENVKQEHLLFYNELAAKDSSSHLAMHSSLADFFTEIEWLLH